MFDRCKTKVVVAILVICLGSVIFTGCEKEEFSKGIPNLNDNMTYELMPYLRMELEDADGQFQTKGFVTKNSSSSFEGSNYRCLTIKETNDGNDVIMLHSNNGRNINWIQVYDNKKQFSIMGIRVGTEISEALVILEENKYIFDSIYDSTEEDKNCQSVFFKKNGVYQICCKIYSLQEPNPYGSLDETDIYMDGVIGCISISCITEDEFTELGDEIGDIAGGGGSYVVENIEEDCAEISTFIEDTSINVSDIHEYGTYIFGDNIMSVDLLPGYGYYSYVSRIVINDECPYKLFGIYYGMDKENALLYLAGLGGKIQRQEDSFVSYDVNNNISLNIEFTNDVISSLECVDNYPEVHDYSGEYIKSRKE